MYASGMYTLAWSFPRSACALHAYWRGYLPMAVGLTLVDEPFSMLGTHYLLHWFFLVVTTDTTDTPTMTPVVFRALLHFSKARVWMRRGGATVAAAAAGDLMQGNWPPALVMPWRWNWASILRTSIGIFAIHVCIGSWLSWYHLAHHLFWRMDG